MNKFVSSKVKNLNNEVKVKIILFTFVIERLNIIIKKKKLEDII